MVVVGSTEYSVNVLPKPRLAPDAMLNAPPVLVPLWRLDAAVTRHVERPADHIERHGEPRQSRRGKGPHVIKRRIIAGPRLVVRPVAVAANVPRLLKTLSSETRMLLLPGPFHITVWPAGLLIVRPSKFKP